MNTSAPVHQRNIQQPTMNNQNNLMLGSLLGPAQRQPQQYHYSNNKNTIGGGMLGSSSDPSRNNWTQNNLNQQQ